jgi:hypothetical protein
MAQGIRHLVAKAPATQRMLLVSDGENYTSEQQFAPIAAHARELRAQLGLVFEHLFVDELEKLSARQLAAFDFVGIKLGFRLSAQEAGTIVRKLAQRLATSRAPLIYFDGDDDLCVQWPDVLEAVDLYVKKHVFSDGTDYLKHRIGKSNLTDYVARVHGRSFADDERPESAPLDAAHLSKLHLGWNIGLDDKIVALRSTLGEPDMASKDIDIGNRSFVKPDVWIHPLRSAVLDRLDELAKTYRVLAPRDRVSQEQYYVEMKRARICVSPFGYGELCWRDFEAILCGCLLVKPDMGHARTYPDIFVDGQTYAAVRWDFSNLAEVCAHYLDNEPERLRIANRAREVLLESMTPAAFVPRFGQVLASARRERAARAKAPL